MISDQKNPKKAELKLPNILKRIAKQKTFMKLKTTMLKILKVLDVRANLQVDSQDHELFRDSNWVASDPEIVELDKSLQSV